MNLPDYFFADLPPEAELTPSMVAESCRTLRRNRERHLAGRPTDSVIATLNQMAEVWQDPEGRFRNFAREAGPKATGFSPIILCDGLDAFFAELTAPNLEALVTQEIAHARRLDRFTANSTAGPPNRCALATGPELLVHIAAGNVPNPTWMSIVLGLLVRSAQFVKCARGTSFLPRLFGHLLREVDPKLASALEIAEWPGGDEALEEALFAEADCVTVTGSDETLAAVRRRVPMRSRFLGYGHRVSFAYITREALAGAELERVVSRAADDIVAWDQLGCLSPHVLYVENEGERDAVVFAAALARELAQRELTEPRGAVPAEAAGTIAARRAFYEVRAAHSPDTKYWFSEGSTAWTVIYEADPLFQASCLHRFVYVKPVRDAEEAVRAADAVRGKVSTVGLAVEPMRAAALAEQFARWGVARVCPLGRMQRPPLGWRHDGRPPLGDLVTWTDWEMS